VLPCFQLCSLLEPSSQPIVPTYFIPSPTSQWVLRYLGASKLTHIRPSAPPPLRVHGHLKLRYSPFARNCSGNHCYFDSIGPGATAEAVAVAATATTSHGSLGLGHPEQQSIHANSRQSSLYHHWHSRLCYLCNLLQWWPWTRSSKFPGTFTVLVCGTCRPMRCIRVLPFFTYLPPFSLIRMMTWPCPWAIQTN
jgi:hypothetical protein